MDGLGRIILRPRQIVALLGFPNFLLEVVSQAYVGLNRILDMLYCSLTVAIDKIY